MPPVAFPSALRWRHILAYGLGDMANNFVHGMGLLFLLNYYTDVVGIGAAAAGTLLMGVRLYDAVMDVAVGRIVDRGAGSRWGRFRPYLLGGAAPLLLLNVAVFAVPLDWSDGARLAYAYLSYALVGTAYSFVNIPYGSLATVMTQAPRERARLGAVRTLMATLTIVLLAFAIGPLLRASHGAELQALLTRFTLALAALGLLLYLVCFLGTRETVIRPRSLVGWRDSLAALRANAPLQRLCLIAVCLLIGVGASSASSLYYARYVLGDPGRFAHIVLTTTLFGALVAVPLTPWLVARLGKNRTFQAGCALAAAANLVLFFAPPERPAWIFGSLGVAAAAGMVGMIVMWALESDTVEYGEWRSGVRLEGSNYAIFSLTRKCGLALGGSIPAFLLAAGGYLPTQAHQPPAVLDAIRQGLALVPALGFAAGFLLMLRYPLSDRGFLRMVEEIGARPAESKVQ